MKIDYNYYKNKEKKYNDAKASAISFIFFSILMVFVVIYYKKIFIISKILILIFSFAIFCMGVRTFFDMLKLKKDIDFERDEINKIKTVLFQILDENDIFIHTIEDEQEEYFNKFNLLKESIYYNFDEDINSDLVDYIIESYLEESVYNEK